MRRLSLLLLFAALIPTPALSADTAAKAGQEQWYGFKFQGHKVGYLYSKDEPTEINAHPAQHALRRTVITVRRQEEVIRMESTTDAWSDLEGRPMRYKHVRQEGRETRTSEGYRDGKELIVRHEVGGNLIERKLPLDGGVYFSSALDAIFEKNLKVGKSMAGKVVVEEDGELKDFTMKVTGTEKTDRGEAFVVEESVAGIDSRVLVLADGTTLRVQIPALGAEFELSTKEKAMEMELPVDIFSAALFAIPKPLPSGASLDELVVRLKTKSGKAPTHISDQRQRAKMIGKSEVELHIKAVDAPVKSPKLPIKSAQVAKFLSETPYESIHDELLTGTAQRVVGGEKNAWEAAKKINAFVHRHIEKKTLARAFATANEALDTKEGDCTEHAVLFSALAKIAGIPTKLVTGLVYVGGKDNVFGYHEWDEVWMGDRWIAMDPTFGQDVADPTHIKFAEGQSDPDGLRDAGLVAASLIGDLDLSVVEYRTANGARQKMTP